MSYWPTLSPAVDLGDIVITITIAAIITVTIPAAVVPDPAVAVITVLTVAIARLVATARRVVTVRLVGAMDLARVVLVGLGRGPPPVANTVTSRIDDSSALLGAAAIYVACTVVRAVFSSSDGRLSYPNYLCYSRVFLRCVRCSRLVLFSVSL